MVLQPRFQARKSKIPVNYFSENNRLQEKVSILITAYQAQDFLVDTLNSIKAQTYTNYDVWIAVDACQDTLNTIQAIRDNYQFKITVMYFKINYGTFVLRNTLMKYCDNSNMFLLDADDKLLPECLEMIMGADLEYEIIRFKFKNFKGADNINRFPAFGVFFLTKNAYKISGGFLNWKCAADSEFHYRMSNAKIKQLSIDKVLFMRRVHQKSLTQDRNTGMGSFMRIEYQNKARDNMHKGLVKIKGKVIKNFSIYPSNKPYTYIPPLNSLSWFSPQSLLSLLHKGYNDLFASKKSIK